MERAAEKDAPKVHGTTNVHQKKHLEHGNVDEGSDTATSSSKTTTRPPCSPYVH